MSDPDGFTEKMNRIVVRIGGVARVPSPTRGDHVMPGIPGQSVSTPGKPVATRRRKLVVAPAAFLLLVPALSACQTQASAGSSSITAGTGTAVSTAPADTKTYRGHGVSFDYPATLREANTTVSASQGNSLWDVGLAADKTNLIRLTAYQLTTAITADNVSAVKGETTSVIQSLAQQIGGAVQSGPEDVTVGGKPGLQYRITGTANGTAITSTLVLVFDGTTEYFLNCQSTQDKATLIDSACRQVQRTFTIG
jgi:hypothetical protein